MEAIQVIKLLIVDDFEANRTGLSLIFATMKTFEVVGMAKNGLEALELCATAQPDVVVMDLRMPEMDGITATQIINQRFPEIKVIILTSFEDTSRSEEALRAGAMKCLTKDLSMDELVKTIQQAYLSEKHR